MHSTGSSVIGVVLTALLSIYAQPGLANAGRDIVGMRVDDFQLVDQTGFAHQLYYYRTAPAIVLMTQSNSCADERNALSAYDAVSARYAGRGVQFFLLNSSLEDNARSIAAAASKQNIDLPVLIDEYQLIGESLQAEQAAEVYVIDPSDMRVVYHGPVDKLADALDGLLENQEIALAEAITQGCPIDFPERERRREHANISYHDTIAPLLERRCVGCHTEGGIGPWAMSSYEMVQGFAPMIREVIRTDRMPPWNADPNVGTFLRDYSMQPEEIKTLVHWIEAGAPRGEGPDPLAVTREPPADWPLGEPDMIIDIPAFDVPATGVVEYQRPVVENPLTEPKWLRASTVKVGSREAVHHVLTGMLEEMPESGLSNESEWGASVGGYAVGAESSIAPENVGTYIPTGGAIGLQMHYTPFGKAVTDATQIGLYFYDEPPELIQRASVIADTSIRIPKQAGRHEEIAYLQFPRDALLYYAFPHAHYRGQSSSLTIRYPDGSEELLLSLPKYNFNWQRSYEFAEPVNVPAGSKLIARYTYDNTPENPANPDPDREITWGDQSFEEMLFTAISYRWVEETKDNMTPHYDDMLDAGRGFGMLDDNLDGMLERHELRGRPGEQVAENFDRMDRDRDGILSWEEYFSAAVASRN